MRDPPPRVAALPSQRAAALALLDVVAASRADAQQYIREHGPAPTPNYESQFASMYIKEALKDTSISTQMKVDKIKRLKAMTENLECPKATKDLKKLGYEFGPFANGAAE